MDQLPSDVFGEIAFKAKRPELVVGRDDQATLWYYHRAPEELLDYLIEHDLAREFDKLNPEITDELIYKVVRELAPGILHSIVQKRKLPISTAFTAFKSLHGVRMDKQRLSQTVRVLESAGVLITTDVVNLAALTGDLQLLTRLHQSGIPLTSMTANMAARGGDIDVMEYVEIDSDVLFDAVRCGHLNVVKKYITEVDVVSGYFLEGAASLGHFDIVEYLISIGVSISNSVIGSIISHGKLQLLRRLIENNMITIEESHVITAAETGRLEIFKYLYPLLVQQSEHSNRMIETAIELGGGLNTLDYGRIVDPTSVLIRSMAVAAGGGHSNIVHYIHDTHNIPYDEEMMNNAAKYGHLDLAIEMYNEVMKPFHSSTMTDAVRHGIEIVNFLIDKLDGPINERAINNAADNGHLDVIKLLVERGVAIPDEAIENAAMSGDLNVVIYLIDQAQFSEEALVSAMNLSISGSHHNIVEYLYKLGVGVSDRDIDTVIINDSLDMLMLIVDLGVELYNGILNDAALGGHFEITNYLLSIGMKGTDDLVDGVLMNGHIDVAELLIIEGYKYDPNLETDNYDVSQFLRILRENNKYHSNG